ncbi:hypothetical protein GGS20DRAFT_435489 [Poronia punctata]|nr:hypothetical protein GGS20DRAFT_435489 [Poronia punctata]
MQSTDERSNQRGQPIPNEESLTRSWPGIRILKPLKLTGKALIPPRRRKTRVTKAIQPSEHVLARSDDMDARPSFVSQSNTSAGLGYIYLTLVYPVPTPPGSARHKLPPNMHHVHTLITYSSCVYTYMITAYRICAARLCLYFVYVGEYARCVRNRTERVGLSYPGRVPPYRLVVTRSYNSGR